MDSKVETYFKLMEYACAREMYQAHDTLFITTAPPPVDVKSYLVASVAFGSALAVRAAVVQF